MKTQLVRPIKFYEGKVGPLPVSETLKLKKVFEPVPKAEIEELAQAFRNFYALKREVEEAKERFENCLKHWRV